MKKLIIGVSTLPIIRIVVDASLFSWIYYSGVAKHRRGLASPGSFKSVELRAALRVCCELRRAFPLRTCEREAY